MQTLAGIVTENVLYEEDKKIDISALGKLDDEIKKAIDAAPKKGAPTNEVAALTVIAIAGAIPGIIHAITKIIKVIAQTSGIQLEKKDPKWYEVLEKVTGEIDNYLDRPFNFILKPFVKDSIKRAKYAKILKAATLALMSIYAVVDLSKIKETTSLIKSLAPEASIELIQAIAEKNPKLIGTALKKLFVA